MFSRIPHAPKTGRPWSVLATMIPVSTYVAAALTLLTLALTRTYLNSGRDRLPAHEERVMVLGASTPDGVGAAIARHYVERGCSDLVLVGRRERALGVVKDMLVQGARNHDERRRAEAIVLVVADCTNEADIARLRDHLVVNIGGIDTVHVVFGAISKRSLLQTAGVDPLRGADPADTSASLAGLRELGETAMELCAANIKGTALALAALLPIMQTNSKFPHVCVIGSLASLVPAPTRALYCATKAAQQMLVLAVATECDAQANVPGRTRVTHTVLAPSSISTSFADVRAGLAEPSRPHRPSALSAATVAARAVRCASRRTTGVVPVPGFYFIGWLLTLLCPSVTESRARARYGY